MKKWAKEYDRCVLCGTIDKPHISRGLCKSCYSKNIEGSHKDYSRNKRGIAEDFLTKEKLIDLYINQEMSLSDIGKLAGTTRQNVHIKLLRYHIQTRSKKQARILALDKGKISQSVTNEVGELEKKLLKKIRFNEEFFDDWSNEMAYVLGLIYTDGNLFLGNFKNSNVAGSYKQGRLTFAQKEKEIVVKFLRLMDCDIKISFRKKRVLKKIIAGELFYFQINSTRLFNRLLEFGLTPNKSLSVKFPSIPKQYVRHFIRGCWDGDGTVWIGKNGYFTAGFVSGSFEFITVLKKHLENQGLSIKKLYTHPTTGDAYYLKYNRVKDCALLYEFLYQDVGEDLYLSRKHDIFKKYIDSQHFVQKPASLTTFG